MSFMSSRFTSHGLYRRGRSSKFFQGPYPLCKQRTRNFSKSHSLSIVHMIGMVKPCEQCFIHRRRARNIFKCWSVYIGTFLSPTDSSKTVTTDEILNLEKRADKALLFLHLEFMFIPARTKNFWLI